MAERVFIDDVSKNLIADVQVNGKSVKADKNKHDPQNVAVTGVFTPLPFWFRVGRP